MTDAINRQDAVTAVRSVLPGTTCRGDAIIAALNAIPAVDEWQPIETAPKDEYPPILVYCPGDFGIENILMAGWRDGYWLVYMDGCPIEPTRWCPLPKPPQ